MKTLTIMEQLLSDKDIRQEIYDAHTWKVKLSMVIWSMFCIIVSVMNDFGESRHGNLAEKDSEFLRQDHKYHEYINPKNFIKFGFCVGLIIAGCGIISLHNFRAWLPYYYRVPPDERLKSS